MTGLKVQTLSKAKQGTEGTGDAGNDAPRIATGFVYSTQNSTAPGAGVTARYNFTGTPGFTSINNNWSENPPTFNSTNNTIYYSRYTAVEEVVSGVPQGDSDEGSGLSFGSILQGTSFTGLVTFSTATGDFSDSSGTITAINGGRIDTNTINTASLKVANPTGTSYLKLFDNKIEIYNSGSLRVKLGNLS